MMEGTPRQDYVEEILKNMVPVITRIHLFVKQVFMRNQIAFNPIHQLQKDHRISDIDALSDQVYLSIGSQPGYHVHLYILSDMFNLDDSWLVEQLKSPPLMTADFQ